MYKDKDKQKEAQREWVRQKRAKQGSTSMGSTDVIPQTIKDSCGTEHPIDYKGRREVYNQLKSWAEGYGSLTRAGRLAMIYNKIKGINTDRYLGIA